MTDVERIAEAVFGAVAGIVLRGQGVNPQEVVAALERVQFSLEQVKAHWQELAREHVAGTNLRNLRTEPVQVPLTDLEREQVGGRWAFKVHKGTTAAKVFERNGWREVKRRYAIRYFVMPDGSEPPTRFDPGRRVGSFCDHTRRNRPVGGKDESGLTADHRCVDCVQLTKTAVSRGLARPCAEDRAWRKPFRR
jgi:hypothetical protein